MIDAHQHCWRIGQNDCVWPTSAEGVIHRDILPEHWAAIAAPLGVTGSVLVQSQQSALDTAWLLGLAREHDFILGVVGWINMKTDELIEDPWLKGIRPMVQGRPSNWLDDPVLDKNLAAMAERGLVFDALIRTKHLPSLRRLAKRHPKLSIVIDHGAKPEIAHNWLGEWKAQMIEFAQLPNVTCKLSGLLTEARSTQQSVVADVAAWLFGTFGEDRLLWGSDWPVVEMAATYEAWLRLARAAIPESAHARVFDANARRIYGL